MEIKTLPTQQPRKTLTVKRRSENLKEHQEAFESANNQKGYLPEPEPHNWIERRILNITNKPGHAIRELKEDIWTLFMDIPRVMGEKAVGRQFVYDRVAAALGYKDWDDVLEKADKKWINNLLYGKEESEIVLAIRNQSNLRLEDFKFEVTMNFKHLMRKIKQISTEMTGYYFRQEALEMVTLLGQVISSDDRNNVKFKLINNGDHYLLYGRAWERSEVKGVVIKKISSNPATGFLDRVIETKMLDDPMDELFKETRK